MGIVNRNPDSFSGDGSRGADEAARTAFAHIRDGADLIDVGAESARTDRSVISEDEEIRRLLDFIEAYQRGMADDPPSPRDAGQVFPPVLSVNTWRPRVAEAALAGGARLLNDMGGLPDDTNARIAAAHGAALLVMHTVGEPKVSHTDQSYGDVAREMRAFFEARLSLCEAAGLPADRTLIDPGIDFAKQRADNLRVLARLGELTGFGRPVLLPVSRKGLIGEVLDIPDPADRDAGTQALIVHGMLRGAHIFRVHAVRAAYETVRTVTAARRASAWPE